MVYLVADHIITPLGEGTLANLNAIRAGRTGVQRHTHSHGQMLVEPVMASMLDESRYVMDGYSLFESLCIHAVDGAIHDSQVCLNDRCVFILSSTKGDIWCSMAQTAQHIAEYYGNHAEPVVVSTACTSGVAAQLTAYRLLETGLYDTAVVVGCDIQREFILSGFQCFHALSANPCRPFDKDRDGLNAGEAVACMILTNRSNGSSWCLLGGSIHNDANHISGPSRTGEGSLRCLQDTLHLLSETPACVSVHGTGTAYNDEMESIALFRAGLQDVPVSALKGYYGHTMGAAGLLETILCLHAMDCGEILPTLGYNAQGTTYPVNLSSHVRQTSGHSLIKLLSGFGGVNAAIAWYKADTEETETITQTPKHTTLARVQIDAPTDLVSLYKQMNLNYPKFYKMDTLSRLGFLSVECLLEQVRKTLPDFVLDSEDTAVIIANKHASVKTDTDYLHTIEDKTNYYPSPAIFVYTLPNIVTGEIAIRQHLFGETACYVLNREEQLKPIVEATLSCTPYKQVIVGWVECESETSFSARTELKLKN